MTQCERADERREIVLEPRTNGRFYQTGCATGIELLGTVVACVPRRTLIIDLGLDAQFVPSPAPRTSLEIFFMELADGSTRLTIVHAELDRFGLQAEAAQQGFAAGWRNILVAFTTFVDEERSDSARQQQCTERKQSLRPGLY